MFIINCLCIESIIEKEGLFFFFFGFVFKAHENKVNLLSCEQENRMGHKIDMYPF